MSYAQFLSEKYGYEIDEAGALAGVMKNTAARAATNLANKHVQGLNQKYGSGAGLPNKRLVGGAFKGQDYVNQFKQGLTNKQVLGQAGQDAKQGLAKDWNRTKQDIGNVGAGIKSGARNFAAGINKGLQNKSAQQTPVQAPKPQAQPQQQLQQATATATSPAQEKKPSLAARAGQAMGSLLGVAGRGIRGVAHGVANQFGKNPQQRYGQSDQSRSGQVGRGIGNVIGKGIGAIGGGAIGLAKSAAGGAKAFAQGFGSGVRGDDSGLSSSHVPGEGSQTVSPAPSASNTQSQVTDQQQQTATTSSANIPQQQTQQTSTQQPTHGAQQMAAQGTTQTTPQQSNRPSAPQAQQQTRGVSPVTRKLAGVHGLSQASRALYGMRQLAGGQQQSQQGNRMAPKTGLAQQISDMTRSVPVNSVGQRQRSSVDARSHGNNVYGTGGRMFNTAQLGRRQGNVSSNHLQGSWE